MLSLIHAIVFTGALFPCFHLLLVWNGTWEPQQIALRTATSTETQPAHLVGARAVEPGQHLSRRNVQERPKTSASARGLLTIDIQKTCRASGDVSGAAPGQEANDGCLNSERAARDAIVKQWKEFLSADKTSCIRPDVYLPSYVEWLTCLELQRDVRRLSKQPK
jgi:hypothetical protein